MKSPQFEHPINRAVEEYFFEKGFEKAYTAVFFIDRNNRRIGMLQRGEGVDFAPSRYTGVGGKIEKKEGHRESALRELNEELLKNPKQKKFLNNDLKEFGRIIINGKSIIAYFALPYEDDLPSAQSGIGDLRWVPFEKVIDLDIIPTTKYFIEEWRRHNWSIDHPFTVLITRKDADDVNSPVLKIEALDGLLGEVPNDSLDAQ